MHASGSARGTPHTAPPRIERYIDPGNEKACRLHTMEISVRAHSRGGTTRYAQEVCRHIADYYPVRIDVAVFLEEGVESLQLYETLRNLERRSILPKVKRNVVSPTAFIVRRGRRTHSSKVGNASQRVPPKSTVLTAKIALIFKVAFQSSFHEDGREGPAAP